MSVLSVEQQFDDNGESKAWNIPVSEKYMFYATGDFKGGTLALEASPDGLTWFTVDILLSPGRLINYLVSGEKVRLKLTAATAPNITTGIRQ